MLTATEFNRYQNSISARRTIIVHITDGTDNWYLADMNLSLTDGQVYDLLQTNIKTSEGFNIFSKAWAIGDIKLNFSNKKYRQNSSGTWVSLSDELTDIRGREVTIYFMVGGTADSLSDCIAPFVGIIKEAPKYNADTLTISLVDKGQDQHVTLPQALMGDSYTDAPSQTVNQRIPIVYGLFTIKGGDIPSGGDTEIMDYTGNGLARGFAINDLTPQKFVFSDHILNAITELWYPESNLDHPAFCDPSQSSTNFVNPVDPVFTADDSGHGTINGGSCVWGYAEMIRAGTEVDDPSDSLALQSWGKPTNEERLRDLDDTNFASVLDTVDAGGGAAEGRGIYVVKHTDYFIMLDEENRIRSGELEYKTFKPAARTVTTWQLWHGTDNIGNMTMDKVWRRTTGAKSIGYYRTLSQTPDAVWTKMVTATDGDGTPDNITLLEMYGLRVRMRYVADENIESAFAACEGREYDTWISSRSSNYSSGDAIEDPAGIIEDIIRNELSLSSSDIDLTSFINAENTSVKARINLHSKNMMNSNRVIRQLAEQSTFAFVWTGAGKAKLIPLNESSPTTNRTIPWSHIKGDIEISKAKDIITQLEVQSRYQQEYGDVYRDLDTYDDATAQATPVGVVFYPVRWPNIAGTSKTHVAEHLVKASTGLWSNTHNVIKFETDGFTNADLELGDWIELDDTTVDPHVKCYGESWSGKQFLIYNIEKSIDSTRITAIEL